MNTGDDQKHDDAGKPELSSSDLLGKVCKNCKYYEAPSMGNDGWGGECKCESFKIGYGMRITEKSQVMVEGDEGWGFVVGPEFGCVHFSA